jgi:protein O-mannosyl-transferase
MSTAWWSTDTEGSLKMRLFSMRFGITAVASILLVAGTVYAPALSHEILDLDYSCWLQAVQPIDVHTLKRVVVCDPSVWQGLGYFAPLTAVSFMADLVAGSWTGHPELIHKAVNIALHLLNSLLVMWLVRILGFEPWVAFMSALIFAVHPLQVSTVAWIAERKNLLMCSFFVLALICHARYRRDGKYLTYAAVLAAYILALLAKPSAVALGPCVFISDLCLIDRRFTIRAAARAGILVIIGLGWVLVSSSTELPVDNVPRLLDRLLQLPYNIGFLAFKFFVPSGLSLLYPPVTVDSTSLMWWLPGLSFVVGTGLVLSVHRVVPVWPVIWGLAFYVVNVIPSSGIVPFAGMRDLYVADHYQYVASVGLCFLAGLALTRAVDCLNVRPAHALKVLVAALFALVLSLRCMDQLQTWRNPHTLWTHVITLNPSCYRAHFNYGTYLHENRRYPEAVMHYDLALSAGPDRPDRFKLYYNLGLIMMTCGSPGRAAGYLEKALEVYPGFGLPHSGLAQIYFDSGQYGLAIHHCRLARKYGSDCPAEDMEKLLGQANRNAALAREPQAQSD